MKPCPDCGFVPQLPPAGGNCPYCGKQGVHTPGCLQLIVWIIVIGGLIALFL